MFRKKIKIKKKIKIWKCKIFGSRMSDIHIPFCRMHSKQDEFPSFLTSFNLVAKHPSHVEQMASHPHPALKQWCLQSTRVHTEPHTHACTPSVKNVHLWCHIESDMPGIPRGASTSQGGVVCAGGMDAQTPLWKWYTALGGSKRHSRSVQTDREDARLGGI